MDLKKASAWVLFHIETDKVRSELRSFIENIIGDFLKEVVPWIDDRYLEFTEIWRWNDEGRTPLIPLMINKEKIQVDCKLFLFDDEQGPRGMEKSILFDDHDSDYSVLKVYAIAEAFEGFLQSHNIKYKRQNRER